MTARSYTAELQAIVGKRCYGHNFVLPEGSDFSHCTECGAAWHKRDGGPIPADPPNCSTLWGALAAASSVTGEPTLSRCDMSRPSGPLSTEAAACEEICKLAIEYMEAKR